jgi:hypothetical protein
MSDDTEIQEYFSLVGIVSEFDQRLITVKSWGVTLSLAGLGLGFEHRSYGMFLVAAISSLAFWILEGAIKRHQMCHYPRMRQIEINRHEQASNDKKKHSAPRMDWSWEKAAKGTLNAEAAIAERTKDQWYHSPWLLPHVALPHLVTFACGSALFCLGYSGCLKEFTFGAVKATG